MKLQKCRWDKKIAGVCGGLGRYFNIDPTVLRLAFIFFTVLTGFLPFLLAYLILAIVMADGPKAYIEMDCPKLYKSRKSRILAGICGGVGEMVGADPVIVRIIFLIALCLTIFAPLIITYIIGMFIIPERPL